MQGDEALSARELSKDKRPQLGTEVSTRANFMSNLGECNRFYESVWKQTACIGTIVSVHDKYSNRRKGTTCLRKLGDGFFAKISQNLLFYTDPST